MEDRLITHLLLNVVVVVDAVAVVVVGAEAVMVAVVCPVMLHWFCQM